MLTVWISNLKDFAHEGAVEYARYVYEFNGDYRYKYYYSLRSYCWTFEDPKDAAFFKLKFG